MRSRLFLISSLTAVFAASALAADIDMDDPHRAVGRENDVRVDAQLLSDVIHTGSPIAVTYQIQNLTDHAVAVAEKSCSASYDADTRTITLSLGSEIPPDGAMPRMVTIGPGEKKVFRAATSVHSAMARSGRMGPRFVLIKVSVLRNLNPFRELLDQQKRSPATAAIPLSDAQFEQWLDGNDTIYLNALPIRFEKRDRAFDASQNRAMSGSR